MINERVDLPRKRRVVLNYTLKSDIGGGSFGQTPQLLWFLPDAAIPKHA